MNWIKINCSFLLLGSIIFYIFLEKKGPFTSPYFWFLFYDFRIDFY